MGNRPSRLSHRVHADAARFGVWREFDLLSRSVRLESRAGFCGSRASDDQRLSRLEIFLYGRWKCQWSEVEQSRSSSSWRMPQLGKWFSLWTITFVSGPEWSRFYLPLYSSYLLREMWTKSCISGSVRQSSRTTNDSPVTSCCSCFDFCSFLRIKTWCSSASANSIWRRARCNWFVFNHLEIKQLLWPTGKLHLPISSRKISL